MKYLTPLAYTNAGEGISLAGVATLELANIIARAEALVDQHCKLPSLAPLSVVDEVRRWNGDSRRVYPLVSPVPIRAISRCVIQISSNPSTGNPLVAMINPNDIVINNTAGYVEIVSFTALTMGLTPVLINLGMNEPLVHLDYTTGYAFSVVDEPLVDTGDHTTYASTRPLWDAGAVIKKNGASAAPTVNATEGQVTFSVANAAGDVVTASYAYSVPDPVRAATVATTTALLGDRALNKAGMTNLRTARAGRMYQAERPSGAFAVTLPPIAEEYLAAFIHYALDGGT